MPKLSLDFYGFLKFLTRASNEVVSWFGPACQHDAVKIVAMSVREWQAMSEWEQKFFVRSHSIDLKRLMGKSVSDANAFLSFLMQKRYNNESENSKLSHFDPARFQVNRADWESLPDHEKQKFADMKLSELGMAHVIEKRNKLHELYEPNKLNKLELLIKTKPTKTMSSRSWFLKMENLSIDSKDATQRWRNLTEDQRKVYEQCALLDKKRYDFEKKVWFTRILQAEMESRELSYDDLECVRAKSNIETIVSIVESNQSLVPVEIRTAKKPLTAFSLFIRAYRYQIRDEHPEFRFGDHLQKSGIAWGCLTDEEKQKYIDEAKELRRRHKEMLQAKARGVSGAFELPASLFKHSKICNGPTKPTHLVRRRRSAMAIYAEENNVPRNELRKTWESLSDDERAPYIRKQDELLSCIESERANLREKLESIKSLINESEEVEVIKKNLRLQQTRERPVRLYMKI